MCLKRISSIQSRHCDDLVLIALSYACWHRDKLDGLIQTTHCSIDSEAACAGSTANEHWAARFIRGEFCIELGNDPVIAWLEQIHLDALL